MGCSIYEGIIKDDGVVSLNVTRINPRMVLPSETRYTVREEVPSVEATYPVGDR